MTIDTVVQKGLWCRSDWRAVWEKCPVAEVTARMVHCRATSRTIYRGGLDKPWYDARATKDVPAVSYLGHTSVWERLSANRTWVGLICRWSSGLMVLVAGWHAVVRCWSRRLVRFILISEMNLDGKAFGCRYRCSKTERAVERESSIWKDILIFKLIRIVSLLCSIEDRIPRSSSEQRPYFGGTTSCLLEYGRFIDIYKQVNRAGSHTSEK